MCVGLISGCVEVWDLDIIDVLEPVLSLSTCHALSALRKRKSKKKRVSVCVCVCVCVCDCNNLFYKECCCWTH